MWDELTELYGPQRAKDVMVESFQEAQRNIDRLRAEGLSDKQINAMTARLEEPPKSKASTRHDLPPLNDKFWADMDQLRDEFKQMAPAEADALLREAWAQAEAEVEAMRACGMTRTHRSSSRSGRRRDGLEIETYG